MLRCHESSPLEDLQDDSPAGARTKCNAFLFACSLMYEANRFINELGRYYAHLPEYSTMVAAFNSPNGKDLLLNNFGPVRNGVAFHFGRDEIETQLKGLKLTHPVFASGIGPKGSQAYYELADLCAMNTFTAATFDSAETLRQIIEPLVKRTSELTFGFMSDAEAFIGKVLEETGWRVTKVPART